MNIEAREVVEIFQAQVITIEPDEQVDIHHAFSQTPEKLIQDLTGEAKVRCNGRNCGLVALCGFERYVVEEEGILPRQLIPTEVEVLKAQIFCRDKNCQKPNMIDEIVTRVANTVKISSIAVSNKT